MLALDQKRSNPYLKDGVFDFEMMLDANLSMLRRQYGEDRSEEELKAMARDQLMNTYSSVENLERMLRAQTFPWEDVDLAHELVRVITVESARLFMFEDQPQRVDDLISGFLAGLRRHP